MTAPTNVNNMEYYAWETHTTLTYARFIHTTMYVFHYSMCLFLQIWV